MESQIKIRATVPEMNTFFEEESGVRYMEIRDRRYSSDEIERMPESKFNSKVFMWPRLYPSSGMGAYVS